MTEITTARRPRKMARAAEAETPDAAGTGTVGEGGTTATTPTAPKPPSKAAQVLALLHRHDGASLDQLVDATGWLPHTTRAALTGLRKKGHAITKGKVDGVTRYAIVAVPAVPGESAAAAAAPE